jgi:cation diffusion facilitator CzcD-associated flavoprotein CzcO
VVGTGATAVQAIPEIALSSTSTHLTELLATKI